MPNSNNFIRIKSKLVLGALYKHGPMSISTMEKVINPPVCKRGLQRIAKRLSEHGLVFTRRGSALNQSGHYHQLCTDSVASPLLRKVLNIKQAEIELLQSRSQELEHAQQCILWHERLEKEFKNATITRDFRMYNDHEVQKLIRPSDKYIDSFPDLLIRLKSQSGKDVSVAVEIERTSKKRSRIYTKLHKFAMESGLDGVLFVCKSHRVVSALSDVFENKIVQRSPRIRHFGKSFMMFCDEEMINAGSIKVYGLNKLSADLKEWMHFLRSTEIQKRTEMNTWLVSHPRQL